MLRVAAVMLVLGLALLAWRARMPAPVPLPAAEQTPEPAFLNSLGMKMVRLPAGQFEMGSLETEAGRDPEEGSRHTVTITTSFYMSATEVTQAQWKALMGDNPSRFQGDELPVDSVSRADCEAFVNALSSLEGKTYRLPTEAEWEFACRAGSTARFCYGDYDAGLDAYAWHAGNSAGTTHPVGTLKSNAFGLYDLHGNVWEWCHDGYRRYDGTARTDPVDPDDGEHAVMRGGSWIAEPALCRSAFRNWLHPDHLDDSGGFRVVWIVNP
ncbi:MAG: formylglycine-generating enzyme family protein [Planctomycetota bacterium]|nr:formylglycine-generating enzyme family protein [Planctomycetota bacterium]